MPHPRFKSENYDNFGGINTKTSTYTTGPREVLALYNLDFSTIGAWTTRPGSTQYIGQTFSTITGFHEFIKTNGFSELIVGSSGGLWAGNSTGNLVGISASAFNSTLSVGNSLLVDNVIVRFQLGGQQYLESRIFTYLSLPNYFSNNDIDSENYLDNTYMADGTKSLKYNGSTLYLSYLLPPMMLKGSVTYFIPGGGDSVAPIAGVSNSMGASFYLPITGSSTFYRFYAAFVDNNGVEGPLNHLGTLGDGKSLPISATLGGMFGTFPLIRAGLFVPPLYSVSSANLYLSIDLGGATFPGRYAGISAMNLDIRFLRNQELTIGTSNVAFVDFAFNQAQLNTPGESKDSTLVNTLPVAETTDYPYIHQGFGWSYGIMLMNQSFGVIQPSFVKATLIQGASFAPLYLENYNNRLAMIGFSGLPSSFMVSEVAAPPSVLPENIIEVRTNDGDYLTGGVFYLNQLILFKNYSVHSFSGDAPENFYLKQLTDQYGCINNKSHCIWQDRLWFLDEKGIMEFNGANIQVVSHKVELQFQQMNLDAAKTQAVMLHQKERNEIWCAIPVNGATLNNLTIVYDYDANAWTYWDGFNPKYFNNVKQRLNKSTGMYADYSGRINHFSASFMSDNGSGISSYIQARFEHPMGQSIQKMFRRMFLNYDSITGDTVTSFNVNFRQDYGSSIVLSRGITLTSFQNVINFGVSAKSLSLEVGHYTTTEKLRIYGYTLEYRYLRST